MTHYYLYIKAGVRLDSDTRFYKVAVGDGVLGRKHLAWLEAFAFEHGHFFVIWNHEAVEFVMKCLESLGLHQQIVVSIPGRDLIKALKNGCDDPQFWQACQHRHQLMMQIDPHYYAYYQLSKH